MGEMTVNEKLHLAMLRYKEALTISAATILLNGQVAIKRGTYSLALEQIRGQYTEQELKQAIEDVITSSGSKTQISVPGMIIEIKFTGELTLAELMRSLEEPSS